MNGTAFKCKHCSPLVIMLLWILSSFSKMGSNPTNQHQPKLCSMYSGQCFESNTQNTAGTLLWVSCSVYSWFQEYAEEITGGFSLLKTKNKNNKKVSSLLFSSIPQSVMQATVTIHNTQACSLLTENRDFVNKIVDVAENTFIFISWTNYTKYEDQNKNKRGGWEGGRKML